MKQLRLKIVDYYENEFEKTTFYKVLQEHYDIVYSDNPDYIICSVFGKRYDYCKYPQIRIMISPENYIPDFNLIDYGVSSYPLYFGDRHFEYPVCIDNTGHFCELFTKRKTGNRNELANRKFCNFIFSHDSEYNIRSCFFRQLEQYKPVSAPGKLMNNESVIVNYTDSSKTDYQRQFKFTICFESTNHHGFVTEKITDAFYAETIPIFFGSSSVNKYFNEKAFIDISKFDSFESAINRIIELDNNDDEYLKMLNESSINPKFDLHYFMKSYEEYVLNIFSQPYELAYRRSRVYKPNAYNEYLINPTSEMSVKALGGSIIDRILHRSK